MSMREIAKTVIRIRRQEGRLREDRSKLRQLLTVAAEREKRRVEPKKGGRKC